MLCTMLSISYLIRRVFARVFFQAINKSNLYISFNLSQVDLKKQSKSKGIYNEIYYLNLCNMLKTKNEYNFVNVRVDNSQIEW